LDPAQRRELVLELGDPRPLGQGPSAQALEHQGLGLLRHVDLGHRDHRTPALIWATAACGARNDARSASREASLVTRSTKWSNWTASGSPVWRTNGISTTVSAR